METFVLQFKHMDLFLHEQQPTFWFYSKPNNVMCHLPQWNNSLQILTLCTRSQKQFIVYFKSNGIIAMKKHVELERVALLRIGRSKQMP